MHSPAAEIVAGYPSGCVVDKDANPETTLGSAYSPVDYMSITSFPRLPEDDAMSGENTLKSRKDDDNVLSEQDTGQSFRPDAILQNILESVFRLLVEFEFQTVLFCALHACRVQKSVFASLVMLATLNW